MQRKELSGAESLGIGTCMNGMVGPMLSYNKKLMEHYGIPRGNTVNIGMIAGYPAVRYTRALRREFSSVVYR